MISKIHKAPSNDVILFCYNVLDIHKNYSKLAFTQYVYDTNGGCCFGKYSGPGFPYLGVARSYKGGRQGKCKNQIIFLCNMGRENHHKIPLIISQISK